MYSFLSLFLYIVIITASVYAQRAKVPSLEWELAAQLKDTVGNASLGFAGAINAVDNGVLLVAGGANFPDEMPWNGGKKYYASAIHVLQKSAGRFTWIGPVKTKLPEPIAYCGYTSTPDGIVYAGGENNRGLSDKAYLLKWNGVKNSVTIKGLPDLPTALTNMALTSIGHTVYAVGGDLPQASFPQFLRIDLKNEKPAWEKMPDLPIALANMALVVQKNKYGKSIYVIGGRTKTASGISELHSTTFVFDLESQCWKEGAPISDGKRTTNFSAGAGVAISDHFILLAGGDDGKTFHKIESYLAQIAQTTDVETKNRLIKEKNELNTNHQGFYRGMLLYNTLTNRWRKIGELPFPAPVTTTASLWNGDIVLSNGEVRPGVRSSNVMLGIIK